MNSVLPLGGELTIDALGRAMPSSRSFGRALIQHMTTHRWDIRLESLDLDGFGRGTAIYRILAQGKRFTFVAFSDALTDGERTERIIARRWDVMAALAEGPVDAEWIAATRRQLPFLRGGRAAPNTLLWTRANRSSRMFDSLVGMLRSSSKVDVATVVQVGYALRNTGVYANGKYGTRPFDSLGLDHPLGGVYRAETFALFMLREFSYDLLSHLLRAGDGGARRLPEELRRYLGVGNGSGLGMVQYVSRHPRRFHSWIDAHTRPWLDTAPLRIDADSPHLESAAAMVKRCAAYFDQDARLNPVERAPFAESRVLADDLERAHDALRHLQRHGAVGGERSFTTWRSFDERAGADLHPEARELVRILLADAYQGTGGQLDGLLESEAVDPDGTMPVGRLLEILATEYGWALEIDLNAPGAYERFWYRSVEAQEPRLGKRGVWLDEFETVPSLPRQVQSLNRMIERLDRDVRVADVLLRAPDLRQIIARVQGQAGRPFGEVRVNAHDAAFRPLYIIRLLLALLGMEKFQPRSEYWVQGTFFQGAPTRDDIRRGVQFEWGYPVLSE